MKCRKLCNIWASREQELALLRLYTFIFYFQRLEFCCLGFYVLLMKYLKVLNGFLLLNL